MSDILKKIEKGPLLFDGAMGTMLMDRGIRPGETAETWVLNRPNEIAAVHEAYFAAGADFATTATFGATSIKLSHYGLSDRAAEINRRGAELARSVCPVGRFVAGDIGSAGKLLAPAGDVDEGELKRAFTEQAQALAEGGVDCIIIETMMDVNEALIALSAARATGLDVFVTISFNKKPRGYFTIMGNKPADAARALADAGAAAVGTNCNLRIGDMIDVVAEMAGAVDIPVIAQPNAGNPETEGGVTTYIDGPDVYGRMTPELIRAGARVVGGCCGTTPETIRRMREVIDTL
ncbi:MAG: homocysteine S-methyltransferase family protein [Deltaproteobacteria bacterium]|nr:homocysteine S-methyltransferase family protein [Candidatus Zymogenaceae bacterium]